MLRRWSLVLLGIGVGAGVVVACGSYDESDSIPPPDASTLDASPTTDVTATTDVNQVEGDAGVTGDADADAGSVSTCASNTPCDCDGDGFLRANCDGGSTSVEPDCDDNDPDTHPGQTFLDRVPATATGGDWNCSKTVEKATPENLSCDGADCLGRTGFVGSVGCGALGTTGKCMDGLVGLSCMLVTDPAQKKQFCK